MEIWTKVENSGKVLTQGIVLGPYGNKPIKYVSHYINDGFGGRDLFLIIKSPGGQTWARIGDTEYSPAEFHILRYLGEVREGGFMLYSMQHTFPVTGYKGTEEAGRLNGYLNQQKRRITERLAEQEAKQNDE